MAQSWVVKGNPVRNNFDNMLSVLSSEGPWQTRRKIPADMARGDRVFLYESAPAKRLIALAEVVDPNEGSSDGDNYFTLRYLTRRLPEMLLQDELKAIPELEGAGFLKAANAATIYRLTASQSEALLRLVVDRNGDLYNPWKRSRGSGTEPTSDIELGELMSSREGDPVLVTHFSRERDPKLVAEKKKRFLEQTGKLDCEVCAFNFLDVFGERGTAFCEVHHRDPLSQAPPRNTTLEDLAVVCSNCHRMLHKTPWTTVDDLRTYVDRKKLAFNS